MQTGSSWGIRAASLALLCWTSLALGQPLPGGTLDPLDVPKYVTPLVIPPAMPRTAKLSGAMGKKGTDYYEIAVRQFRQQILPPTFDQTTVWSYGSVNHPGTFNYPAFTIEAKWKAPVRVKWINELVKDPDGCFHTPGGPTTGSCEYLPHLLPVDQTLHWANPTGTCAHPMKDRDCRGTDPEPYSGPVPMIVHVHGSETNEWADGYPEAWYLPAASNLTGFRTGGSFFETFKGLSPLGTAWTPGSAVFEYPNDQPATTLWYHDHSLGMTRQNVYAGPAGFYLLRGGPGDLLSSTKPPGTAQLPGPAPALGDPPGLDYYEIPIVIQDRSFNADGSLFYPDNRAFFEGLEPGQLQIPFIPDDALNEQPSDVSPIWNPEFFGNTLVTNGRTWPMLQVEPRRYRLRFLNGCNSRFLILRLVTATDPDDPGTWKPVKGAFWQIGAEQGFLPAPIQLDELLMGLAERADTIVDFGAIPIAPGEDLYLVNVAPDEPFGGGTPGIDFAPADPSTTGQVMKFVRLPKAKSPDKSTPPAQLVLPAPPFPGAPVGTRRITLNEAESATVYVIDDGGSRVEVAAGTEDAEPFGPTEALLGTLDGDGVSTPLEWAAPISENVALPGDTEVWEIFNFTADAHPIHIHLVQFQVLDRQGLAVDDDGMATQPAALVGPPRPPEAWETGLKDTVISYPGEVTRVKATYPLAGLFVWHCHILEHEDNEMMRPYCVGSSAACQQHDSGGGM